MFVERTYIFLFADFVFNGGRFKTLKSATSCAVLCANTFRCSSYFYNKRLGSCSVSLKGYRNTAGLTSHAGYRYYWIPGAFGTKCKTERDCLYQKARCRKSTCECKVGYSYDSRSHSCVKRCTQYGRTFARNKRNAIDSCNKRGLNKLRKARDCMRACLKEQSFTCISIDHHPRHPVFCQLCDKAWFDLPKRRREDHQKGWTLYYRNCAM